MRAITPSHLVLGSIGVVALMIGANTLVENGNLGQFSIVCVAITLALSNFIITDIRNRQARAQYATLTAQYADIRRAIGQLAIQEKKNKLGIGKTHDLLHDNLKVLETITQQLGEPRRPGNIHRVQ